jgi:hypothetical protein
MVILTIQVDNMFSRNTSKSLTFTVTSDEPVDEGLEFDNNMCGWLLKKRRKRMQGNIINQVIDFKESILQN